MSSISLGNVSLKTLMFSTEWNIWRTRCLFIVRTLSGVRASHSHTLITCFFQVLMGRLSVGHWLHCVFILTLRKRLCVCVHNPFCERISLQEKKKKTWLTWNIFFLFFVLLLLWSPFCAFLVLMLPLYNKRYMYFTSLAAVRFCPRRKNDNSTVFSFN